MDKQRGGYRPGAGRPWSDPHGCRKHRGVKASDFEWETIRQKSKQAGLSMNEYILRKSLESG